jgi:hypothetical protein
MRSASSASTIRPVRSSSKARDAPIQRGSIHDTPMSQPDSPMRTKAIHPSRAGCRRQRRQSPPDAAPFTGDHRLAQGRIFGTSDAIDC